jgi:hypothetical protein
VREIEDALRIAERSGDDSAVALARMMLGVALAHRQAATDHDRGQKLLAEVSEVFLHRGHNLRAIVHRPSVPRGSMLPTWTRQCYPTLFGR